MLKALVYTIIVTIVYSWCWAAGKENRIKYRDKER